MGAEQVGSLCRLGLIEGVETGMRMGLERKGGLVFVGWDLKMRRIGGFQKGPPSTIVASATARRIRWRRVLWRCGGQNEGGGRGILKEGGVRGICARHEVDNVDVEEEGGRRGEGE